MAASSDLDSHLKEALGLTSARWAALADFEGGKWNLLASQRLTRSMQGPLLRLLEDPAVSSWLDGISSGGSGRPSQALPAGLGAARLFAFPVSNSRRILLVAADGQNPADGRVWRLLASLLPGHTPAYLDQPTLHEEVLASLPYDLPGSLERILKAFTQAVPCQSAALAIRRGETFEVLAAWNDANLSGESFQIESNELLRRLVRTSSEQVALQGQPDWDLIPPEVRKRGMRAWVCLPLVIGQRLIGVVMMGRTLALTPVEWQTLRELATYLASSVEVAATFSEMSAHLRRLGMLNDFALTISSAQNLDQIARRVFDLLARTFGTEMVALFLLSIDGRMVREFRSRERRLAARMKPLANHPIAPFLKKARLVRADTFASGLPILHENARSVMAVPLRYRGQVIGSIHIESPRPEAFSQYDENLMVVVASHLAGLAEYGRLREEAEGRARSLGLIHEMVQQVIGLHDLQEMAQITADLLAQYFGYELAAVVFEDREQNELIRGFGGKHGDTIRKIVGERDRKSTRLNSSHRT